KYGVSANEVERDLKSAIDYAYSKKNRTASEKAAQGNITSKDKIPTPDELIKDIARLIMTQNITELS
ncbi:MAG: hypothetical protein GX352_07650, partial [Clostridiales bacterium]|nr:hypothetical protein [Clostridiales bacterium]